MAVFRKKQKTVQDGEQKVHVGTLHTLLIKYLSDNDDEEDSDYGYVENGAYWTDGSNREEEVDNADSSDNANTSDNADDE